MVLLHFLYGAYPARRMFPAVKDNIHRCIRKCGIRGRRGAGFYSLPRSFPFFPAVFLFFALLPSGLSSEPVAPALHTPDGPVLWQFSTGGSIRGTPAVAPDGSTYFLSEDWYLYAVAPEGNLKWRFDMKSRVSDSVGTGVDGTIYAASEKGMVYAINPLGRKIWSYRASAPLTTSFAFDNGGTLYFGTADGILLALSHLGVVRWRYSAPGGISAGPVFGPDGTLFLASSAGVIYALNRWGDTLWSVKLSDTPLRVAPGPEGSVSVVTAEGRITHLLPGGTVVWNSIPDAVPVFIQHYSDTLRAVLKNGEVLHFDEEGRITDRVSLNLMGQAAAACASPDGSVFITTDEGALSAVDGQGQGLWQSPGRFRPDPPALSDSGTLFAGGDDWVLTGFSVSSRRFPPLFPLPAEHASLQPDGTGSRPPPDYIYLKEFSRSEETALKEVALKDIEERFRSGRTRDSGGYLKEIVKYFIEEALFAARFRGKIVVNNHPEIRVRAVNLLARIADQNDLEYFLNILRYEYDPTVRASLVRAIGSIRSDRNGKAVAALAGLTSRWHRGGEDEQVAAAVIDTLTSIYEYHGHIGSRAFADCLLAVLGGDFSRTIREKAIILLRNSGYN